jgi:hypothetical protein
MTTATSQEVLDLQAKLAALLAEREALAAELAVARAKAAEDLALIAHQRLTIAKLQRQIYGPRSERTQRLLDQLELTLEDATTSPMIYARRLHVCASVSSLPDAKTRPAPICAPLLTRR